MTSVEERWEELKVHIIRPGAPEDFIDFVRKTFYAGYFTCFQDVNQTAIELPEEEAMAMMNEIDMQMRNFFAQNEAKRGDSLQ
jgi:lipoate-protein ligase A